MIEDNYDRFINTWEYYTNRKKEYLDFETKVALTHAFHPTWTLTHEQGDVYCLDLEHTYPPTTMN